MGKVKILVTAAVGNTGFPCTLQLLEKGYSVRALVRRSGVRSEILRRAGAEIFIGNMLDIRDVRRALSGIQRAYYCPPFAANQLHTSMIFAIAANEARLEVVTKMTQWFAQAAHPSFVTREHWLTDHIMPWMPNVDVITINPSIFAQFYLMTMAPIAHTGIMAMPLGESLNAPASNEDMASVIVGTLIDPAPHIGKCYRPTGPKLLSPYDIAEIFSRVLERKVKYSDVSVKMFVKAATAQGFSRFEIAAVRSYFEELKRGTATINAPNNVVQEIGGRPAEDFEATARKHVAHDPRCIKSLSNKLKTYGFLVKMLLTPAPDMDKYERQQNHPLIHEPVYSRDAKPWLQEHHPSQDSV